MIHAILGVAGSSPPLFGLEAERHFVMGDEVAPRCFDIDEVQMNRPFRRPDQQGRIDGMCAVYAVLNTCKLLFDHSEKQDEALFKHLCQTNARLFPKIVYDGTGVPGVRSILTAAQGWVEKAHPGASIVWSMPMYREGFVDVVPYFDHLKSTIEQVPADGHRMFKSAWIVGLNVPWNHWTCIHGLSDNLVYFYDSYGMRRYRRTSFTLDESEAGDGKGRKILIDEHQSFFVGRLAAANKKRRSPRKSKPRMTDAASHGDGRVN